MEKFIICGFDSENSPVQFNILIQSDDTAVINGYNNSSVTDDNSFLCRMLSDSHWKLGSVRSWSDREAIGLGHAIIQYVLNKIFDDTLWFSWVSIVRVE